MLAAVITCSDRAAAGIYPDRSGPLLREALNGLGFETREPRVVPDNLVMIRAAIREPDPAPTPWEIAPPGRHRPPSRRPR